MPHSNVTGAMGVLGFGLQSAKEEGAADFRYMRVQEINFAPGNIARQEDPTVGGRLFPADAYKSGVAPGGSIAFQPLAEAWGLLLCGLAGSVSSEEDESGVYVHEFKPVEEEHDSIPWLTVHRNLGDGSAEEFQDCRVTGANIIFAATQPLAAQMNLVGRIPYMVDEIQSPTLDNTPLLLTVDSDAVVTPSGVIEGNFRLADDEALYARSIQFAFGHQVSDDDFVLGSPYLDDVTLLYRTLTVTVRTKLLKSDTLYKAVYYGGGSSWSALVQAGEMEVSAQSAAVIPGKSTKYKFAITVPSVEFMAVPIAIRPGLVALELTGVLAFTGGGYPYDMKLTNTVASYTELGGGGGGGAE